MLIELGKSINEIENKMLQLPQVDCPVRHIAGNGLYVRELFMPAGTLAIGHEQKTKHLNVFIKGKVMMLNQDGSSSILEAPKTFYAEPGRKIGYVLEDVIWQNIYPTNETDINALEDTYLNKSDEWKYNNALKMGMMKLEKESDRIDFNKMLDDVGYSKTQVEEMSENESDYLFINSEKVQISDSPIQGKGLFASSNFEENEIILIARKDGKRTQSGRFTNHSINPNAYMAGKENGDIYLIAKNKINGCKGGELGDEITIDYRQAVEETRRIGGLICLE
jgi:hypothetical protein